jgi:hypothetical protein
MIYSIKGLGSSKAEVPFFCFGLYRMRPDHGCVISCVRYGAQTALVHRCHSTGIPIDWSGSKPSNPNIKWLHAHFFTVQRVMIVWMMSAIDGAYLSAGCSEMLDRHVNVTEFIDVLYCDRGGIAVLSDKHLSSYVRHRNNEHTNGDRATSLSC